MDPRRVVILLAIRRCGENCVVQVRSVRAVFKLIPIMILHQDNENGLNRRQRTAERNNRKRQCEKEKQESLHKKSLNEESTQVKEAWAEPRHTAHAKSLRKSRLTPDLASLFQWVFYPMLRDCRDI